jgi:hypothetical protein
MASNWEYFPHVGSDIQTSDERRVENPRPPETAKPPSNGFLNG